MPSRNSIADRGSAELRLLQFLCSAKTSGVTRKKIARVLAGYSWNSADHAIFFECIRELLARRGAQILDELPAAATRRGFPDMNCEALAAESPLKAPAALALARGLMHL